MSGSLCTAVEREKAERGDDGGQGTAAVTENKPSPSSRMLATDLSPHTSPPEGGATPITETSTVGVASPTKTPSKTCSKTRYKPRIKRRATGYVTNSQLDILLEDSPTGKSISPGASAGQDPTQEDITTESNTSPAARTDQDPVTPTQEDIPAGSNTSPDASVDQEVTPEPAENTGNSTATSDVTTENRTDESANESAKKATIGAKAAREMSASEQQSKKKAMTKEEFEAEMECMECHYKLLCEEVQYYLKEIKELEFHFNALAKVQDIMHKIHEAETKRMEQCGKILQGIKYENDLLRQEKAVLVEIIEKLTKGQNKSRPQ